MIQKFVGFYLAKRREHKFPVAVPVYEYLCN